MASSSTPEVTGLIVIDPPRLMGLQPPLLRGKDNRKCPELCFCSVTGVLNLSCGDLTGEPHLFSVFLEVPL